MYLPEGDHVFYFKKGDKRFIYAINVHATDEVYLAIDERDMSKIISVP